MPEYGCRRRVIVELELSLVYDPISVLVASGQDFLCFLIPDLVGDLLVWPGLGLDLGLDLGLSLSLGLGPGPGSKVRMNHGNQSIPGRDEHFDAHRSMANRFRVRVMVREGRRGVEWGRRARDPDSETQIRIYMTYENAT